MRIGVLGTGNMAAALGAAWAQAGHGIAVGGRSTGKARALADRLGGGARGVTMQEAATDKDAVLLAVPWAAVEDVLGGVGAGDGSLRGTALIDPVNAVDHGVGVVQVGGGGSAAQRIAALAPGAHVVKAFHLFPSAVWEAAQETAPPVVAMCGDDAGALDAVGALVRDAGGVPAVLGPLSRARQLEEVAGVAAALHLSGVDPSAALPSTAGTAGAA
ncbi:NAD(P)-binding domain-containing protein [Nocardiopsis sp. RSe5-2]|uniref:NAD(P)-binding domain-containing protein n=1 Tax=Nocardiopsis endophytica TaxID=3018445 RepID=A0ABT4UA50_9ACTN|nr:NAD(P)-binding domain-containing protein [Nocardiopsis endophytica]MDA2813826.1 NAD(P)-binding domain-containing protein [Nocardiopsis endophytica]